MKIILFNISILFGFSVSNAQVVITESSDSTPTNSSVLLEFGSENKGIILPTTNTNPIADNGTFIFDKDLLAVMLKNDGVWINLTDNPEGGELYENLNNSPEEGEGVIIGADQSSKSGALILESSTKAMILPKVFRPEETMLNPIAGTMVYDTEKDAIAVCDGKSWSYWR